MANEIATANKTFDIALTEELQSTRSALPADFNITRFVQNSVALVQGNDTLMKFAKQYGSGQIRAGLIRGAYLGLDALHSEFYLVPYGNVLNFMASYKGNVKLAKKYSSRPIKDIYAKLVREGDSFEESIEDGRQTVHFKALPFNDGEIIGVFAVCLFEDGGLICESMSRKEIENTRNQSKAKNAMPWMKFYGEMAKKTVLHRLCKSISLDMDAAEKEAFDSGLEIETDAKELARREIEENENSVDFESVVDGQVVAEESVS